MINLELSYQSTLFENQYISIKGNQPLAQELSRIKFL